MGAGDAASTCEQRDTDCLPDIIRSAREDMIADRCCFLKLRCEDEELVNDVNKAVV